MSEKPRLPMDGKIEKISVADSDAADWIKTLTENGFTNDEIDRIMSHLNETYKNKMTEAEINKEFSRIKEDLQRRKGYELDEDEAERIRHGIASRFK